MASGCSRDIESASGGSTALVICRVILLLVCASGAIFVARAVSAPEMDWRLVTVATMTALVGPLFVGVSRVFGERSIFVPLVHPLLFGSTLALGPLSAIPAMCAGIGRLLNRGNEPSPVFDIIYSMFKPAAACAGTSVVFHAAGGSFVRPHEAASIIPMIWASAAYVCINTVLAGTFDRVEGRHCQTPTHLSDPIVSWLICLSTGYAFASLYSIAPAYVIAALAATAFPLRFALREPRQQQSVVTVRISKAEERAKPEKIVEAAKKVPAQATTTSREAGTSEAVFLDQATGLASSRYLDMFLQKEVSRSERASKPLSVAVFDVDGYKNLEKSSSATADELLARMGRCIKRTLREYDLVARYSAGRLVVVLPETGADEALEVAQRLYDSVNALTVGGESVKVSAGVATFPENGTSAEELINLAHHALNLGRFAGGNRVHSLRNLAEAS